MIRKGRVRPAKKVKQKRKVPPKGVAACTCDLQDKFNAVVTEHEKAIGLIKTLLADKLAWSEKIKSLAATANHRGERLDAIYARVTRLLTNDQMVEFLDDPLTPEQKEVAIFSAGRRLDETEEDFHRRAYAEYAKGLMTLRGWRMIGSGK